MQQTSTDTKLELFSQGQKAIHINQINIIKIKDENTSQNEMQYKHAFHIHYLMMYKKKKSIYFFF